jgi:hypothetical protein
MAHNITVDETGQRAECSCGWWCSATFGPVLRAMLNRHSSTVAVTGGVVWLALPAKPLRLRVS